MSLLLIHDFNVLRLVLYLPHIRKILRDTNGSSAISYLIWRAWLAAVALTAVYSVSTLGAATIAWINAFNTLCCAIVIIHTGFNRRQFQSKVTNCRRPAMR